MNKLSLFVFGWLILGVLIGCAAPTNNGTMGSFKRSLNHKWHGYNVVEDPTGSAPTKHVERFEVRAGDCFYDPWWSDCKVGSERSELSGPKEDRRGKEEWYGWYIYFPKDWQDIVPASNIYGQFYQAESGPLVALQMSNQGLRVFHYLKEKPSPYYNINLIRGKWTKVEMHVKWLKEIDIGVMPDAFMHVYVNDTLLYSYKGNTVSSYGVDSQIYFKYGNYRVHLKRNGITNPPTQVVYYSGVSRAKTKEGLFVGK